MSTAPETVMDAAELCRARDLLGYTDQVLAADLGLPPNVVAAWTSGRAKVPKHIARDLRWRAALIEQEKMFAESGLAACEWVTRFEAQPIAEKLEAPSKRLQALIDHQSTCPTCHAREEWVRAHCPPLPPPPIPLWTKALVGLVDRLPTWAAPAVFLGVAFGGASLFRLLFFLPQIFAHPRFGLMALGGLLASIAIGATLGAIYGGSKHLWTQFKSRRAAA